LALTLATLFATALVGCGETVAESDERGPTGLAYIADFYELISRADSLMEESGPIKVIVDEETAAFFAGQKTAREVAEIIESRVQVYVDESR
jgi:hypothetical protein